jgi:predicted small integral membrane protein
MIRLIKTGIAVCVSLFCLFYAAQNLMNLQAAHGFVGLMASMADHVAYPNHFGPAITSPALVWIMLFIIIGGELLAGLFAARGALSMWGARKADAETFNASKTHAYAACGIAILVWFGIFSAFGGAYFQMWQTAAGETPLMHASTFSIQFAALWVVLALKDD